MYMYVCMYVFSSFTSASVASCTVKWACIHKYLLVSSPVKITEQPHHVQGEVGGSASLCCRAMVIPPSSTNNKIEWVTQTHLNASIQAHIHIHALWYSYIWLKSNMKGGKKDALPPALKFKRQDGRLTFEALGIAHSGYYVCQACLKGQWVESDEVQLSVTMPGG